MTKKEFLNQLNISLTGKLEGNELKKQLQYYDDYINSSMAQGKTEEEVMRELGDPRLIAKTIASTAAMSNPMHRYYQRTNQTQTQSPYTEQTQQNTNPFKWYHKLIMLLPLLLVLIVIVAIVFSVVGIVIRFILPVLIVVIVSKIVIEAMHRR